MNQTNSNNKQKSLSSQEDTRNPTTNKKVIFYTPVQRKSQKRHQSAGNNRTYQNSKNEVVQNKRKNKNKSQALSKSMHQLSSKKQECIRSSRFQQAKNVNKVLKQLQRKRATTQIKKLLTEHKKQRKSIKKAHQKEMSKFQNVWQNYFIGLRAKQQITLVQFQRSQQNDIKFIQNQLIQKCKSIKIPKGQLSNVEKKQKSLLKQQRFDQLIVLKKQKRLIKHRLLQEQQQKIYKWAKQSQDFLKQYHTKKYNTLMSRIQQTHNDKYRRYQGENNRLKQKYHNVLRKLEHQQRMQMNTTLQKYSNVLQQGKQYGKVRNKRSFTMGIVDC